MGKWSVVLACLLGIASLIPTETHAQDLGLQDVRRERGYVPVHLEREVRDAESNVVRARYRIESDATPAQPEVAARAFLQQEKADFGISDVESELRLVRSRETAVSRHLTFEQVVGDVPVFGRLLHVNLDRDGRPTMVVSGFEPSLKSFRPARPSLSIDEAFRTAESHTGHNLTLVTEARLVVVPSALPVTAYHMIVRPEGDFAEWSILVDVQSGEVIEWVSTSPHAHASKRGLSSHVSSTFRSTTADGDPQPEAVVDGIGYVFDPDPLTTAGVEYGAPYVNANDADVPELNAERKARTLQEITLFTDGRYRLQGPYVTIVGNDVIGATYTPPAPTIPEFLYTRGDDFFEAANAYYHIDESQRYTQSLDIDVHRYPVRVNPHGLGSLDDSQYLPASNAILFGKGGIDDAEDAEVIWHEYAHALLESASPGLLVSLEGRALHEGWADYWAVSYTRDLIEEGQVPPRDWRKFATWDGNETWSGRYIDHAGRYPDDAPCARGGTCNIYQDGLLWATTLMEIWTELGRRTTDQLNLASHAYLAAPVTMRDAAEAIIQADQDLTGGANTSILIDVLQRRGFVDPLAFAPLVRHDPPASTEDVTGTIRIEVAVETLGADVSEVRVMYAVEGEDYETLLLDLTAADRFAGDLPLPGFASTIRYFIEADDELGRRVRLPATAPADRFEIEIGPDTEPPVIRHDPLDIVHLIDWPVAITAEISDRIGVESAIVKYEIGDLEGDFPLIKNGNAYSGRFPDIDLDAGTTVSYRIVAADAAVARNESRLPAEGGFSFVVTDGVVLRAFDFDGATDQGLLATGAWQRGEPSYGVFFAHEGIQVWATRPDGTYPAEAGLSTLTLPPVDLSAVDSPYLVFWHWFDTEHDGQARGPQPNLDARLWDGGNLKVSTDGGSTWSRATPQAGYTGTIAGGYGNPLGGEPGFGGHSKGWRQEVVPLPIENDVRVRFEFGTDDGNVEASIGYAGWYIDAVSIQVGPPEDGEPPVILASPPQVIRVGHVAPIPDVAVMVDDGEGVESVRLPYEVLTSGGMTMEADTLFLSMSPTDRSRFEGRIAPSIDLEPRWSIVYTVEVRDFGGNRVTGGAVHRVDIVYEERRTVMQGAHATGAWQRVADRWSADGRAPSSEISSVMMSPLDLPSNAETLNLVLRHRHRLDEGTGGNVKISSDDGRTWGPLTPVGGYDGQIQGSHRLAGQDGFQGLHHAARETSFDLLDFAGEQVRLRFDYASSRDDGAEIAWTIESAILHIVAENDDLETPRRYALHTPYPNPVRSNVTIGYSLESQETVLLEVVDVLGRRVDVLVWAVQSAGVYTMAYDASRLASGTYILSLTTDRGRLNRQIVKIR